MRVLRSNSPLSVILPRLQPDPTVFTLPVAAQPLWQRIRADGPAAFDGSPTSPCIEALRAAWLDTGSLDEQRRISSVSNCGCDCGRTCRKSMGEYRQSTA